MKGYSDLDAANLTLQQQVKEAVMQNNKVEEGEGMVTVEGDVGRGRRTTPRAKGESIRSFQAKAETLLPTSNRQGQVIFCYSQIRRQ